MKTINDASFIKAAVKPPQWPPAGPAEVAFAGRSNVGKSSLINSLVGRKKLVRVSKRPGRTQELNFFAVNQDRLRLVDLPGYGFAKVPVGVKAAWGRMIEAYLSKRETLAAVVVILDIRREPRPDDLLLLEWLKAQGVTILLAITKADKFSNNQVAKAMGGLKTLLGMYDPAPTVYSAVSGRGRDQLWERILAASEGVGVTAGTTAEEGLEAQDETRPKE